MVNSDGVANAENVIVKATAKSKTNCQVNSQGSSRTALVHKTQPVTFADAVLMLVTGLVPGEAVVETVVEDAGADAE